MTELGDNGPSWNKGLMGSLSMYEQILESHLSAISNSIVRSNFSVFCCCKIQLGNKRNLYPNYVYIIFTLFF